MLEEMRKMIAEQLNCEESEITADTSFKDDLGAVLRYHCTKVGISIAGYVKGLVYDDLLNKYPNLLDETKKETTIK